MVELPLELLELPLELLELPLELLELRELRVELTVNWLSEQKWATPHLTNEEINPASHT